MAEGNEEGDQLLTYFELEQDLASLVAVLARLRVFDGLCQGLFDLFARTNRFIDGVALLRKSLEDHLSNLVSGRDARRLVRLFLCLFSFGAAGPG